MESVEEMCDYIALIDQSNKILEGKLDDIKRAFRTNTFQVGLATSNPKEVEAKLKQLFTVSPADFRTINEGLKLNIALKKGENQNDLLSFLTSQGQVQHFVELVPDANEIFIKAVNKNS
jgi:ABC-2 type transport system ATP-binding protein